MTSYFIVWICHNLHRNLKIVNTSFLGFYLFIFGYEIIYRTILLSDQNKNLVQIAFKK